MWLHGVASLRHFAAKRLYQYNPRSVYALYTVYTVMICVTSYMDRMIVPLYRTIFYNTCMSQQIPILSKSKVKAPRKKPNPKTFAQCRISIPEYEAESIPESIPEYCRVNAAGGRCLPVDQ